MVTGGGEARPQTLAGWSRSRWTAYLTGMHQKEVGDTIMMLKHRTTTDDLEGLFDKYGRIGDVYIPKDYRTKESRGFGFVRYFNK